MRIARFGLSSLLLLGCLFSARGVSADEITYAYSFTPPVPSPATPRIKKIELNSDVLEAGGTIAIRVTTSPDVVSVQTGSGKHEGSLARSGRGVFVGESTLPRIGGFVRVRIRLRFAADTADGREVVVQVPVTYK